MSRQAYEEGYEAYCDAIETDRYTKEDEETVHDQVMKQHRCGGCGEPSTWYDHESECWRCEHCEHTEDETPEGF